MAAPKFKLISKISAKTVAGKQRRLNDDQTQRWLFEVAGVANSKREGESDYGPWVSLMGTFMAKNLETGEIFRSGQCFLPNVALNSVLGVLDGGATGVQMAFRVGIIQSPKDDAKTEYIVEPLLEVAEDDPAAALLAKVSKPGKVALTDQSDAGGDDKGKSKDKTK